MLEAWEVNDDNIFLCRLGKVRKRILKFKRQLGILGQLLSVDEAGSGKRKNTY